MHEEKQTPCSVLTKSLYGGLVSVKIFKKLQVIPVNFTSMLSSSINTAEENKRQIRSFKWIFAM